MVDLEHLCKEVNSLAREVGAFIKLQKIGAADIETKSKNSLVTYVDKNAEKMIVKKLSELLPEAGFITEEETTTTKGEVYNWIIDPLDGTDRKSTRLNSSHVKISYAVFCLKKKKQ